MIAEKTITICGKEVKMRYCLAAERGYEQLSGKGIEVFTTTVTEWDEQGKPKKVLPPEAKPFDYDMLALAAIVAAYERNDQDPPITAKDIQYDMGPKDREVLVTTVIDLRLKWYDMPSIIKPETEESPEDREKNA